MVLNLLTTDALIQPVQMAGLFTTHKASGVCFPRPSFFSRRDECSERVQQHPLIEPIIVFHHIVSSKARELTLTDVRIVCNVL